VSHLLPGIWPSSLVRCLPRSPLSSGEENREIRSLYQIIVERERENISPHPEEYDEEYGCQ
jgi:hypothetical protein